MENLENVSTADLIHEICERATFTGIVVRPMENRKPGPLNHNEPMILSIPEHITDKDVLMILRSGYQKLVEAGVEDDIELQMEAFLSNPHFYGLIISKNPSGTYELLNSKELHVEEAIKMLEYWYSELGGKKN
jgi:hypothetical protein